MIASAPPLGVEYVTAWRSPCPCWCCHLQGFHKRNQHHFMCSNSFGHKTNEGWGFV
jgi:hypothetical protein